MRIKPLTVAVSLPLLWASTCALAEDQTDLAKQLANPISALISLPIQVNYDKNLGTDKSGSIWKFNIQPVIPFGISDNWNVISRTILPLSLQYDFPVKGRDSNGLGDTVQSFFFSPKEPISGGVVWGVGPVLLLPTASDDWLGGEKWGAGPTAVVLRQQGSWTMGGLANHIESFAGNNKRDDISMSLLQPFITYITETKTTFAVNTESTYNWKSEEWAVPLNFNVSQMLKIGSQIIQAGVGIRYWAKSATNGAEDWGARFQLTFIFPK